MHSVNHARGGMEDRPALSINETAIRLGVSTDTVRRLVSSGQLAAFRVGGKILRIRQADVDSLMQPVPTAAWPQDDGSRTIAYRDPTGDTAVRHAMRGAR